jgi:hypothetical protein
MNRNLVGSIYGRSSIKLLILSRLVNKHGRIRNKNCLWWPFLLMDWDEISTLYREPPIDASYQVSVHLAKRFQSIGNSCFWLVDF